MALIGAMLADVRPGYCAIGLTPHEDVTQQHGMVMHGRRDDAGIR
jgi:hypothetical protein